MNLGASTLPIRQADNRSIELGRARLPSIEGASNVIDRSRPVGDVRDLVINLLAAMIAFVSGALTRELYRLTRSRRGRAFWGKRMLGSRTVLFVGEFPRFNHLEPSGLVGLGDFHAVHEMTDGLAALNSSFEVAYASQATDGQYRENMIMLGGTEVNSLTATILDKTGSTFRLDNDAMTLTDTRSQATYGTEWDIDLLDGRAQSERVQRWVKKSNEVMPAGQRVEPKDAAPIGGGVVRRADQHHLGVDQRAMAHAVVHDARDGWATVDVGCGARWRLGLGRRARWRLRLGRGARWRWRLGRRRPTDLVDGLSVGD